MTTIPPKPDNLHRNAARQLKLGINFSLNESEKELFDSVSKLLNIPEGSKKELFMKALQFVYKEKKGKEFSPKKKG